MIEKKREKIEEARISAGWTTEATFWSACDGTGEISRPESLTAIPRERGIYCSEHDGREPQREDVRGFQICMSPQTDNTRIRRENDRKNNWKRERERGAL